MAQEAEKYPLVKRIEKPNTQTDSVIKGKGNFVSDSALNVIVFGDSNCVGENVKDSQIFNSSGCVISAGLKNVSITNCSGVVAVNDDEVWANNSLSKKNTKQTIGGTSVVLISVPVASGAVFITADILGLTSDASAGYVGNIIAGFRIEAGNLILINTYIRNSTSDAGIIDVDATATVSGNNAEIIITPFNTTVNWVVNYTVQKI